MSHPYQLDEAKQPGSWSARSIAYLILGISCFACAVIATFGSMFSSILIAGEMAGLVAAPIFIGLVGFQNRNRIFPAFEAFGCTVMLISLGSIYIGDVKGGSLLNAFIHDPAGWVVGGINFAQLILSIDRLRPRTDKQAR